jgi:hypothetical protein
MVKMNCEIRPLWDRMPTALIDFDRRLVGPEIEAESGANLIQQFRLDAIAPKTIPAFGLDSEIAGGAG